MTTNTADRSPKFLYEKVYCARGRAKGFIKNHKTFLHRTAPPAIDSRPIIHGEKGPNSGHLKGVEIPIHRSALLLEMAKRKPAIPA